MTVTLTTNMLHAAREYLARHLGLQFSDFRLRDLKRGLIAAAQEFGYHRVDDYVRCLLSSNLHAAQIDRLAGYLTIGETYFFREQPLFDLLRDRIIPNRAQVHRHAARRLRIWCAGCATGEEPYSVAILLKRHLHDFADWRITLLATDINPVFLARAKQGVYRDWSFRGMPEAFRQQYFTPTTDDGYELDPTIRDMVSFQKLNLAKDAFPSVFNDTAAMDVILCRNVLMYFVPELVRTVIRQFYECLAPGGWFVVGAAELASVADSGFVAVHCPDVIVFQKSPAPDAPERCRGTTDPPGSARTANRETARRQAGSTLPDALPAFDDARGLFADRQYEQAVNRLTTLLADREFLRSTRCADAMMLLSRAYANLGKLHEAKAWCSNAIGVDKMNPLCYHFYGVVLQEHGDLADAVTALRRALYLNPDLVVAHVSLGDVFGRLGKRAKALRQYQIALSMLRQRARDDVVSESENLTAGYLTQMVQANMEAMEKA